MFWVGLPPTFQPSYAILWCIYTSHVVSLLNKLVGHGCWRVLFYVCVLNSLVHIKHHCYPSLNLFNSFLQVIFKFVILVSKFIYCLVANDSLLCSSLISRLG